MPMTVITLTNVPNALRGELTKWLQEISTGVYVGNINTRIREELWNRIIDNIKQGQATMSFAKYNEIGYDFIVHNANRKVIYYDGIPLVFLPKEQNEKDLLQLGFSNAGKYEKIKKMKQRKKCLNIDQEQMYVVIDVETTGISLVSNQIIEIAAIKKENDEMMVFQELIKIDKKLPKDIMELTSITDEMLENKGKDIEIVLEEFLDFVGMAVLVGYNIKFDIDFINVELKRREKEMLTNKTFCLMKEVKKTNKLLRDYKLGTVLNEFNISAEVLHRAYSDARAEYELAEKLNVFCKSKV